MEFPALRPQFMMGLLFGLVLFVLVSVQNGNDPAVLLAAGEANSYGATPHIVETMGRTVPLRPFGGHDGQAYYLQALDPFFLGTTDHILFADRPIYRSQRMLFPVVIGLGGLAPAPMIPWMMGLVNAIFFGVASAAVGAIAHERGFSRWLALSVPLNLGLLMEFGIGGAQIMAFALALVGLVLVDRDRLVAAGLVFAASALTRETMVVFVGGVLLHWMYLNRRIPFVLFVPSAVAGLGWAGYLRLRIEELPTTQGIAEISLPLDGLRRASASWGSEQLTILAVTAVLALIVVWASAKAPSPLMWGAAVYIPFATIVGKVVWVEWYDFTRILHPIFTAAVFVLLSRTSFGEVDQPAATPVLSAAS